MPSSSLSAVVQHLRAAAGRDRGEWTDGELLTLFLSRRDEDALAALVERHAPMVWGVCRRILRNPPDAEDAFQATFLVLVQKAATVVPREMLANWLHGVAQQTAVRLRTTAAKRGWREVQMDVLPEPVVAEVRDDELLSLLDEELGRLPERHRALIVLCDLEGRTRKEVARHLGCPEGTVASGLVRARALLTKRLTRRGLAVSGGSLAATLSHAAAAADVPASVVTSAINVATLLAAGNAAGAIPGPVAALTQGVLKTMFLKKIMTTAVAVMALGVVVILGGTLTFGQTESKPVAGKDVKATVEDKFLEPAAKQEKQKDKEAFTAWGKEVGGVQAGLGFKTGENRVYTHGETVTVVLRVRNAGKEEAKFSYYHDEFRENPPGVTVDGSQRVPLEGGPFLTGLPKRIDVTLEPGKTVDLTEMSLGLRPAGEKGKETPAWKLFGTGTFRLKYDKAGGYFRDAKAGADPILGKLATGELELEVREPGPVPQDKKEAFTAWGKEVGGLQAGLACVPGDKKTFRHRETVTLAVRVRNVGKEVVKFQYLKQFLDETPLAVTDASGMPVPHPGGKAVEGEHAPVDVALKPGEEVMLESKTYGASGLPFEFVPLWSGVQTTTHRAVVAGPGKFGVRYERVLGNSSAGTITLDPALEKLATGTLELEIGKVELEVPAKANPVTFTVKNATVDDVDAKAGVISVSFGNKEKPTKLVNVPLDKGARVVASHVLPGVTNNLPFEWSRVEWLKGRVVSVRLAQTADGLAVVSISSGND